MPRIGRFANLDLVPVNPNSKLLRAYVDETGDRGMKGKASDYFAFAGIVVSDEDEPAMRAAMSQLRRDFGTPAGRPLHWKDHVKTHDRRQHAAAVLAKLPLTINYVAVEKSAIPATANIRGDQAKFYNYAAGILMERLLLTARHWPGGQRDLVATFGHVRGFRHQETQDYFALKRDLDPAWVPWARLRRVSFDAQVLWDGLQAADQYAGMLSAAICPDRWGGYEHHHFMAIRHQIRRDSNGKCDGYGFKWLGNQATVTTLPWWPANGL
jgi:hypothetical protein